jgi:tRNA nucleotidyltransferase (CCA-adding enzyme)
MPANPKLIDKLSSQLPTEGRRLLEAVIDCAGHYDMRAFLVGGPIRDLLLERPALDIDVSVEGDAIMLANAVAREAHAKVVKRSEFGTAALKAGDFALDLATARSEVYPRPGALPRVRSSTIDDDLLRRDFTINAIALELAGTSPGRLLDPVGGIQDARAGQVRVLHDRSFQDDPTRIIRAIRYETRLGFWIEEGTYDLIQRDLAYLETVSGTRIRQELTRTFAEPDPAKVLARMQKLGVLQAIHPGIRLDERQLQSIQAMSPLTAGTHPVVFALLAWHLPYDQFPGLVSRLALTKAQREAVLAVPAVRDLRPELVDDLQPSEVDALLSPYPWPAVLALGSVEDSAASYWSRKYIGEIMNVRTELRGNEVEAMGIPRGPKVGEVLALLRAARLDGVVKTREDEEKMVRDLIMQGARA